MVELDEVLISDIHTAALTDEIAHALDSDRTKPGVDLPDGVYPVSVSVRLDRATANDSQDPELKPPQYPAPVKYPADVSPYIPETTVWLENPAIVDSRGSKIWDNNNFAATLLDEIKKVETKDPDAIERFYLTSAKFVEILDKSWLVEDEVGRMRPRSEFFEQNGEMAIAHFTKRPTITNDTVKERLRSEGAMSGQVKQPLRLTRYDRVWAKPHLRADTTRRFWTPGQAKNNPGIEVADVRPHAYKLPGEITRKDQEREGWVVHELQVGLDEVDGAFPELSQSDLWLKVTFVGDYDTQEQFIERDVVVHGRAIA